MFEWGFWLVETYAFELALEPYRGRDKGSHQTIIKGWSSTWPKYVLIESPFRTQPKCYDPVMLKIADNENLLVKLGSDWNELLIATFNYMSCHNTHSVNQTRAPVGSGDHPRFITSVKMMRQERPK